MIVKYYEKNERFWIYLNGFMVVIILGDIG